MELINCGDRTSFVNECFTSQVICMLMHYQYFNCLRLPRTQQSFNGIDVIYVLCSEKQLKSWPKFCSVCMKSTNLQGVYPGSKDLDEDHLLASFLNLTHSPSQSKWWLTEAKFTLFMSLHSCAGIATSVRTEKKFTLELP